MRQPQSHINMYIHHKVSSVMFFKFYIMMLIILSYNNAIWSSSLLTPRKYEIEENFSNRVPKHSLAQKEIKSWGINEYQLDQLFNESLDLVCLADVTTQQFLRVNAHWTEVLGWTEQELLSRKYLEFIHPDDISDSLSISKNVCARGKCIINFENRYLTSKGDYRLFKWFNLLSIQKPGIEDTIISIAKDITAERQDEIEKQQLEKAQLAAEIKSSFVTHISHEVRTPLNSIVGFLNLSLEEALDDKVRNYLNYALESTRTLTHLTDHILDLSRIEANALKIEITTFNINNIIEKISNSFSIYAHKKKLDFCLNVSSSLPDQLEGDPARLEQILFNLTDNAIKHTSQGSITIDIKGQGNPHNVREYILLGSIKDTGIGMDENCLKNLFTPFFQTNRSRNRQFSGTGLSLYITKQLCEKMQGKISVLSEPDFGSTFQFKIVMGMPLQQQKTITTPTISNLLTEILPVSDVLIVDDNPMNCKILNLMLTKLNCRTHSVTNGLEAIHAIEQTPYQLILMDGEMPVMDGLEATQNIRRKFTSQQLPIIGVSAHAAATHRQEFLAAGMNGYISKPVTKKDLVSEIQRCFKDLMINE